MGEAYKNKYKELTEGYVLNEFSISDHLFSFVNNWYYLFSDEQLQILERDLDRSNKAAYAEGTRRNLRVQWESYLLLSCKQDIYWIGFVSGFGFYRRQISKRSASGYKTFRALAEYSFVLLN